MKNGYIKGDRIEDSRMKSDADALNVLLERFCSKSLGKNTASEGPLWLVKDGLGEVCRGLKT